MNITQKSLLFTLLAAVPAVHADLIYDWSESGSSLYGSGSGTLAINPALSFTYGPYTIYPLTSLAGTFGGAAINTDINPGGLNGSGLVFATGAMTSPTEPVAGGTLIFTTLPGGNFQIQGYVPSNGTVTDLANSIADSGGDAFNIAPVGAPVSAPEPAQVVSGLVLAGMGGLNLLARRLRKRK